MMRHMNVERRGSTRHFGGTLTPRRHVSATVATPDHTQVPNFDSAATDDQGPDRGNLFLQGIIF